MRAHAGPLLENLLTAPAEAIARGNRLLAQLAPEDRSRFLAACEVVALKVHQVLMRSDARITHAYFPLEAIVSIGVASGKQACFGVGLVGQEGMVGLPLLLAADVSALSATVVSPGRALRIAAAPLQDQLLASEAVRLRLERYILVSLTQLAQANLCTHYHRVNQRVARWLLMTQDRVPGGALHVTHEVLAATLGVRRASVTRAAAVFQQRQLIAYRRGKVTLLDRPGLQAAACACYAADCASYAKGMRPRGPA